MPTPETQIIPPKGIPLQINGWLLKNYMDYFMNALGLNYSITSSYRSPEQNRDTAGAAANSAHIHNLAYDLVLKDAQGNIIPEVEAKRIFNEVIKPNWMGYAQFELPSAGEVTYHIHMNLPRSLKYITNGVMVVAGAFVAFMIGKKYFNKKGVQ